MPLDHAAQEFGIVGDNDVAALQEPWVEQLLRRCDARSDPIELSPVRAALPCRTSRLLLAAAGMLFDLVSVVGEGADNIHALAVFLAASFDPGIAKVIGEFACE